MALRYNGVEFPFVQTNFCANGPEKDPSGSDQTLTTISLQCRSIINVGVIPGHPTDQNAGGTLARLRHLLTAPRKPMYFDLTSLPGQTSAKPIINLPLGRDDAGGPWPDPKAYSAEYITPGTIEVTWACTVKLRDCGGFIATKPLSLRWQDSLTWDETWRATYRRVGTVILSTRSDDRIDYVRRTQLAPVVLPGFHRTQAEYVISRDGLRCEFSFTDQQIRFAPPACAVRMSIIQSESFPMVGGMRSGQVDVQLVGFQNANVTDLARWAVKIAKARTWAATPLFAVPGAVIGTAAVQTRETTDGLEAGCSVQYKVQPTEARQLEAGGGSFWRSVGQGAAVGGLAGTVIPGVGTSAGAGIGAGVGVVDYLLGQVDAPKTQQGADPAKSPVFPWIGYGTTPPSATNPKGYQAWADPYGSIGGPAEGVGLAREVVLFANLLGDPCGAALDPTPYAANVRVLNTAVRPEQYNTAAGGQGGATPGTQATVTASLSSFNASAAPSTYASVQNDALWKWDGLPGVYDCWQCLNEYVDDPGMLVIPTCKPNGVNIKVNPNSQMITLRRRWVAKRTGAPPTKPPRQMKNAKGQPDPNWVYTGGSDRVRELRGNTDGVSVIYEASGIYEYEALDASKVDRDAAVPPFINDAKVNNLVNWADDGFNQLVGGPAAGPSGGNGLPQIF